MNKTLFVLLVALLLSSCDPMNDDTYVKISVTNNTDKEFLVYCEYPITTANKVRSSVLPNKAEQVILDKLVSKGDSGSSYYYFQIWLYNKKDSTYCILGDIGEYKNNINWNYLPNQYYSFKEVKDKPDIYHGNYSFVIDESLLPKMVKNTHLTDSVFGLKNK